MESVLKSNLKISFMYRIIFLVFLSNLVFGQNRMFQSQNGNVNKGALANKNTVTNGLLLYLDAGNPASYSGTGTTWTDLSGNGNNATLMNGASYSNANGGSIAFDGLDDYVTMPLVSSTVANVTMQCWVNITLGTKGAFIKNGNGLGYTVGIGGSSLENVGNNIIMLFAGVRWIPTTTSFVTPGWKLVTMILNSSGTPSVYINSTLVSGNYTGVNSGIPVTGTYLGRNIGDETPNMGKFTGNIAASLFYTRVLTIEEITNNYDAQKGRYGL